ncbi:hypothetical protein E3A20_13330 [Planctomyces bekefii]|uniref:Queuine tRNA-ribosyltransferase n=1 Tax=Planctomyces bekefii TaxID=1653850 RepID=A0A5C6M4A0_9PLAN|nr:hypothetical protein E3A20_13330 [Planctomyces bekefii]
MIVYLAGDVFGKEVFNDYDYNFNRLDSYYYLQSNKYMIEKIPLYKNYLLDSGAFTFIMAKKNIKIDIDSYTDKYIDFIIENKINNFFEMDVDKIFGYEKVKQLRNRIESKTGKRVIPVFHKNRGIDDWNEMIKDYKYISIGIAGKDVSWGDHKTFLKFVNNAKEQNCKVHGLGITGMKTLEKVPFYSVDSSSWTAGNRYKCIFKFDGNKIKTIKIDLTNKRIHNHIKLAKYNFNQWNEFSKSMSNKIII